MKSCKKDLHTHTCTMCKTEYRHLSQEACTEPVETICGVCKKELES